MLTEEVRCGVLQVVYRMDKSRGERRAALSISSVKTPTFVPCSGVQSAPSVSKYELLDAVVGLAFQFFDVFPDGMDGGVNWRMCRSCFQHAMDSVEMEHHPDCKVGRLMLLCLAIGEERKGLPVVDPAHAEFVEQVAANGVTFLASDAARGGILA